jgi:DNA-binding SARP family transcriptional activator/transcriptional regulator with XRE-family HTH domain/tetratricopeptide (TPR) repeat protein
MMTPRQVGAASSGRGLGNGMGGADPGRDAALLRRLRVRAGLSQKELAERTGLSVRALRNLESGGVVRPHAGSIRRLADALAVAPETLADALCGAPATGTAPAAAAGAGTRPAPPPAAAASAPDASAPAGRLRVSVLGPLVVHRDAATLEVASAMQRTLLSLLALQHGTVVGTGAIVDLLWPEAPPRTCLHLVHTYIGQLRRMLGPDRIRRSGGGYVLQLAPHELDLAEFDACLAQARAAASAGAAHSARQFYAEAWACWRGPLPAALDPRLAAHPAAAALELRRTAAVLEWADAAFSLAVYDEVLAPLRTLRAGEPLHEALAARLMLALAGDGQQAAALAVFDEVRALLDAQLGVAPGAELRAAQLRVLRGRLPASARPERRTGPAGDFPPPAQLPADVDAFTGRGAQLDILDAHLPYDGPGGAAGRVVAIVGMGGVGKTALAVRWAHRVRDGFPDGQLYVDLRGHSGAPPLRPLDALAGFLLALGVPGERIPQEQAQAAAVYRSRVAGRRLLVVLDNAADAAQVRPLLPTGPGSLAVVTGRDRMTGLVARDGARLVPLDALTAHESVALLEQMIGPRRAGAEPEAVAQLARLCAHLPLALRIAAANLAARPRHRIADFAARLAGDRLGALEADGDPDSAIRATFELSCGALPAAERRVFRLLGTAPGPDISLQAAAALAGLGAPEAEAALDRLTGRHLVQERAAGRYGLHDLLRLYAAQLAGTEESARGAAHATDRLVAHYRAHVAAAAQWLYPHVLHVPAPDAPRPGAEPPRLFADRAGALAWFDAERANLVALVLALADTGRSAAAWGLADLMTGYFVLRTGSVDWRTVAQAAHVAALADGGPVPRAATELALGMVEIYQGRHAAAQRHLAACAALAEQGGWTQCQAVALNNLGRVLWAQGRFDETVARFTEALELHRRSGRAAGEAVTLANLAAAHLERSRESALSARERRGRIERVTALVAEALEVHRAVGDARNEADTLRLLAEARRDLGDLDQAGEQAAAALKLARAAGDLRFEINALNVLAGVEVRRGRPQAGLAHHARAGELAGEIGDPRLIAEARLALAETCTRLGRDEEAALHVEDARELARQIRSIPLARQCERAAAALRDPPPAHAAASGPAAADAGP